MYVWNHDGIYQVHEIYKKFAMGSNNFKPIWIMNPSADNGFELEALQPLYPK